jgi:predicted DNA binding protein
MSTEEEVYTAESLKFINSYKKNFSPVLSNIASDLNANNELIEAMNAIKKTIKKNGTNSNLKELITMLSASAVYSDEVTEYKTNGVIDHTAYVKQTLELMNIKESKKRYYKLLFMVMQDMKGNNELMDSVQTFKQRNRDWIKMVGMLIPKDARVKIKDGSRLSEGISKYSLYTMNNKTTPVTSNQLSGTVVERGVVVRGGEFLKIVSLPKDILRHKKYHKKEFKPEEIELYEPKAETGEGEREALDGEEASITTELASQQGEPPQQQQQQQQQQQPEQPPQQPEQPPQQPEQQQPEQPQPEQPQPEQPPQQQQGGQQRTTRKHKNSIIGSARKTRTNR